MIRPTRTGPDLPKALSDHRHVQAMGLARHSHHHHSRTSPCPQRLTQKSTQQHICGASTPWERGQNTSLSKQREINWHISPSIWANSTTLQPIWFPSSMWVFMTSVLKDSQWSGPHYSVLTALFFPERFQIQLSSYTSSWPMAAFWSRRATAGWAVTGNLAFVNRQPGENSAAHRSISRFCPFRRWRRNKMVVQVEGIRENVSAKRRIGDRQFGNV